MTIPRGERIFCDTNVFLSAVDRKRELHEKALHVLNLWPNEGVELCVSGQVLRELIGVCTRPPEVNGLGLEIGQAVENAHAVMERCTVLDEHRAVAERLLELVSKAGCTGKQVHDANIVATVQEHGLRKLITDNRPHFHRFPGLEIVDLVAVGQ